MSDPKINPMYVTILREELETLREHESAVDAMIHLYPDLSALIAGFKKDKDWNNGFDEDVSKRLVEYCAKHLRKRFIYLYANGVAIKPL